jgi:hypothetical protein
LNSTIFFKDYYCSSLAAVSTKNFFCDDLLVLVEARHINQVIPSYQKLSCLPLSFQVGIATFGAGHAGMLGVFTRVASAWFRNFIIELVS